MEESLDFVFERYASTLKEQGYSYQEIAAVLSIKPDYLYEVADRLKAVRAFSLLPEAQALASANKRIGNILKKSDGLATSYSKTHMLEHAEKSLADALDSVKSIADSLFENGEYTESLCQFAKLREPVDEFFDKVMVNDDDPIIRENRLGLLATLHQEMNRIADLSKLAA